MKDHPHIKRVYGNCYCRNCGLKIASTFQKQFGFGGDIRPRQSFEQYKQSLPPNVTKEYEPGQLLREFLDKGYGQ